MKASVMVIGLYGQSALYAMDHLPKPGESVLSSALQFEGGGKGYNQALCVQRMGRDTTFVTAVGDDAFGACATEEMKRDGIFDPHAILIPGKNTAFASVLVDSHGENVVIVDRGACLAVTAEMINALEDKIAAADVLLLQCELPVETLEAATALAEKHGVYTILNPAPARKLPEEVLKRVDLITPNWTEAHQLCGFSTEESHTPEELAVCLQKQGCSSVVITMGGDGAFVCTEEGRWHQPAFAVHAVDTTGAGDTFNGALAAKISEGCKLDEAIRFAAAASAISVSRRGVLQAIPTISEVENFLSTAR